MGVTLTVGGGKGGIGKSTVAAYVGMVLASRGASVGFIDADLGGPNLHTCLGVKRPRTGLQDFLFGRASSLAEIALPTAVPNTWLVGSSGDGSETANLSFGQKQRLINGIRKSDADYTIIDLGAGSDTSVTDFFSAFPMSLVVSDGLPASIENAYSFLKSGVARGLSRIFPGRDDVHALVHRFSSPTAHHPIATIGELLAEAERRHPVEAGRMRAWLHGRTTCLVANMVRTGEDVERARRLAPVVKKYLGLGLIYIGYVVHAPEVREAFRQGRAPAAGHLPPPVRACCEAIAKNLGALTKDMD